MRPELESIANSHASQTSKFVNSSGFNSSLEKIKLGELIKETGQFLLKSFGLTSPLPTELLGPGLKVGLFSTKST
ncbi:hypothetical protein D1609_12065 [Leptospira borgpetersenii serovar Hardjo-bovis]|nr:hypothetical protein B9T54_12135 [Leptospira borgpetersenii serovar Hardjo-bovis]AYR09087.1 hypothetical protein D1609_12065 [Leptospira borgpetersenii serovar Hardjo-bovis]TQE55894.1 hypothetical protein FFZ96_11635 [Leptospira borgpetersenii]